MMSWAIGGLAAMVGIWAANRRAEAMEKQAEVANNDSREKRFRDGVTHLGRGESSARLGGIYGLYQLAQDYSKVDDKKERGANIIDILCAHIRQTTSCKEYQKTYEDLPSGEIQSMLNLLFRKKNKRSPLRGINNGIDLSKSWLRGANLQDARFQGAILEGAQLQGAVLEEAQLQGSFLRNAQLQGAKATGAQLQGADLMGAILHWTPLDGAQLQGANLGHAQLQKASLRNAQLQGALLGGAQLQEVNLVNTHLHGVHSKIDDRSSISSSFKDRIRKRVGRESDPQGIIFSGELEESVVEEVAKAFKYLMKLVEQSPVPKNIQEKLSQSSQSSLADELKSLREHVGRPASHIPPSEAITGRYSQKEADRWIAEFDKALNIKQSK